MADDVNDFSHFVNLKTDEIIRMKEEILRLKQQREDAIMHGKIHGNFAEIYRKYVITTFLRCAVIAIKIESRSHRETVSAIFY
jgi:hypothetical protein